MPGWETRLMGFNIEGRPGAAIGDEISGAQATIPVVHHKVHKGETFQCSYKSPEGGDIADDGVLDMLFITNRYRWPHFVFLVAAGGDAEVFFYEDVTYTDIGIPMAELNLKRSSAISANLQAYHTPVVSIVPALLLYNAFLPGGTQPRTGGSVIREDTERILRKSTNYFIRFYNRSGGAQPMGVVAQWYEKRNN